MADSSAQATSVARFLAIAHIFLGFVLVCFGIADYVTRDFFTGYICFGIWTGLWMGITGILGVAGTRKEQTNSRDIFASVFMGFSITSAVFGGLIITFYSIAINSYSYKDYYDSYYLVDYIAINSSSYKDYYDSYYLAYEAELSITGIILFIGILEFLLGIWAAICCCVMKVCACCNSHAQSQQMYGQIMQPTMTYGPRGPVAVPMQNPVGLGAVQTESQIPQEGQPQMIMMPVSGPMGGQPQVMQVLASGTMPTAQVSQGFEMAESAGHGKYMTLNNDQTATSQSSDFVNHSYDYQPNWTPHSPTIILTYVFRQLFILGVRCVTSLVEIIDKDIGSVMNIQRGPWLHSCLRFDLK